MGVECFQHVADGVFAEFVGVGVGDVLLLQQVHHLGEPLHAGNGVGGCLFLKDSFEPLGVGRCCGKRQEQGEYY